MQAKILPYSLETEQSVLAIILTNKDFIWNISLTPEMFYLEKHQTIFKTILQLKQESGCIDLITVSATLENEKNLDKIGGRSYLAKLLDNEYNSTHLQKYSHIIEEKYLRRLMIQKSNQNLEKLYDESIETEEVLNTIKQSIVDIKLNSKYSLEDNPELIEKWYEEYDKPVAPPIKTGLVGLDRVFGGFAGTELAIILGNTNSGKTSLLLNLAKNMAEKGKRVLFFSLEMSSKELNNKLIAITGNHSAFEIYQRAIPKDQLHGTVIKFRDYPITIISRGAITSNDVISETYSRKIRDKVDVVMVDYLQRLSDKTNEGETIRLKNIAQNLKNFALINSIPIITPVQVDKASSQSGKIEVENVAWAKAIADEADIAFYLYEKGQKYVEDDLNKELRLRIVKSRNSPKYGDFKINFDRVSLRMTDDETLTAEDEQKIKDIAREFGGKIVGEDDDKEDNLENISFNI